MISIQRVNEREQTEEEIPQATVVQEEQPRKKSPVDKNMREKISSLHTTGHNPAYITQMRGRPASTIKSIIRKYNKTGEVHASRRSKDYRLKLTAEKKNK